MHHFVNGGGGAYLSIGAAMASRDSRPTHDWAIYPSREPLIQKIDSLSALSSPTRATPGVDNIALFFPVSHVKLQPLEIYFVNP